ncbi:MAG: penicillin-binding protein [Herminiimonas sp.]|nr:penicillin-binding protein [Herminiimonas sp.]
MDNKNTQQHGPQTVLSELKKTTRLTNRQRLLRVSTAVGMMFVVIAASLYAYVAWLLPTTPNIDYLVQVRTAQPSVILTADGTELTTFRRTQQEWVTLDRVSPYVINALIATEDRRFYEHRGVDIGRTLSAIFHTAGGDTQGGSTITQQLARNLFPDDIGRLRSINRKMKEIITAIKIERFYSKQQILETYLNTVPFLYNVSGIEMAARTYYGKSAAELDLPESATLVGMLKGTHYYNPVVNPERARARRNVVLAQMVKYRQLSDAQYRALRDKPLQVRFNKQPEQSTPSSHFTEYVRKWMIEWADENDIDLYSDGLVVHTTLDDGLQEAAIRAVARQADALQNIADVEWGRNSAQLLSSAPSAYARMRNRIEPFRYFWDSRRDLLDTFIRETPEYKKEVATGKTDAGVLAGLKQNADFIARLRANKTRLEAGFVAIDPATGEVKVWVGSRDFQRDQFDHVAQAERQPGSTFKPIVYGAALEQGFSPNRAYQDRAVEIRSPDGAIWRPTDMTAPSGQPMTLREGLIYSRNRITAQVMQDVGMQDVLSLAQAVGVNQSKLDPVPSLALGTSPVTLLEMVSAYATIAQVGEFRKPVVIKRITDRNGKVLAEFGNEASRAMSEQSAIELIDMMRGVVTRGTGQVVKSRFGIVADIAGKTGTTQNNTDGWFIMMHPDLVAGSWVGFNDSRVTMRSSYWGQGGHNAILVVGDFFRDALKKKMIDVKAKFPKPKHAAPVFIVKKEPDDWADQFRNTVDNGQSAESRIIIRRDNNGTTFIGDAQGEMMHRREQRSAARTPEELAHITGGMGRNEATESGSDPAIPVRTQEWPEPPGNAIPARSGEISNVVPQSFR